jgi:hypothetical protein
MGSIITCICCYCCLTPLKPRCIEILALLFNLIEFIFLIWGIVDIPWGDISVGGKIIFYIMFILIIITFLILISLIYLRCSNKINTTKNNTAKCLCTTMVILDILAFIFIIIAEIIILYNIDDKDDYFYYDDNRRRRRSRYSDREWAAAIISHTIAEMALVCHAYCSIFLLKLIYIKTDLSYFDYMNQKDQNNNMNSNVNVFNGNQNNLILIGYNKNGHPVYSLNNQNLTQETKPNNTTNDSN